MGPVAASTRSDTCPAGGVSPRADARAEHAIRRLPPVRSCTVTDTEVVVLVESSGREVASDVAAVLEATGLQRAVRVLAPPTATVARPSWPRVPLIVAATLAAVAVALMAGLALLAPTAAQAPRPRLGPPTSIVRPSTSPSVPKRPSISPSTTFPANWHIGD